MLTVTEELWIIAVTTKPIKIPKKGIIQSGKGRSTTKGDSFIPSMLPDIRDRLNKCRWWQEVMCGGLVDKFGISWQIVPKILLEYMENPITATKATGAFMKMKKLIIQDIEKAVKN